LYFKELSLKDTFKHYFIKCYPLILKGFISNPIQLYASLLAKDCFTKFALFDMGCPFSNHN
jgi:hypothetical protein